MYALEQFCFVAVPFRVFFFFCNYSGQVIERNHGIEDEKYNFEAKLSWLKKEIINKKQMLNKKKKMKLWHNNNSNKYQKDLWIKNPKELNESKADVRSLIHTNEFHIYRQIAVKPDILRTKKKFVFSLHFVGCFILCVWSFAISDFDNNFVWCSLHFSHEMNTKKKPQWNVCFKIFIKLSVCSLVCKNQNCLVNLRENITCDSWSLL